LQRKHCQDSLVIEWHFSYFETTKPSNEDIEECENIMLFTPRIWNPHSDVYALNEDSMPDHEGNMVTHEHRERILLAEVEDDPTFQVNSVVGAIEASTIGSLFEKIQPLVPLKSTRAAIDPYELCSMMAKRLEDTKFMAAVGATYPYKGKELFDDITVETVESEEDTETDDNDNSDNSSMSDTESESETESIHFSDEEALDAFMVSAAHAGKPKAISAEYLSKIWRIDLESAKNTLKVTTQGCNRTVDPAFTRNYSTNDRMLQYK
jgi:hypothetical protein